MKILLLILLAVTIVAFVIGSVRNIYLKRKVKRGELEAMPETTLINDTACCGKHDTCEKQRVLRAFANNELIYFDDEELDAYKGRRSDTYSETEVTEFREILTTMQEHEVKGWLTSLQLRDISVPDALKDEIALIVQEHEMH